MLYRTLFFIKLSLFILSPAVASQHLPRGASFEVAFSPYGEAQSVLLRVIGEAENSIEVAAYAFTSTPVALALVDAYRRGVRVRLVADEKSSNGKYSAVTFLANQGVPVRTNGNYAICHHKFMVVDGKHVQTGSFNFSAAAANKNAENVIVLRYVPDIAKAYFEEWQRLWDEGKDVEPRY